ncbi:hypothetical protein Tco_0746531 [Tanacetum coccineum]
MTNPDQPSAPPTLTLVEKLYAVHNINTLVPEKLDLAESNYSTWSYFFKGHCSNFGVLKHIEGSCTQSSTSTPPMDDWITADSIVKSWIFLTLSSTLRKRLIKANPKIAKDAWDTIEAIFQDNKRTRVVALKGELRMIQMGDWKRIFKKRNKKKAKHKQIQAREGKDQEKSEAKVSHSKKIQLEGLKLPSLKLYYKRLKDKGQKCTSGRDCIQVI